MTVGQRIKKIRNFLKMSQDTLSKSLNIVRTNLTGYEIDRTFVPHEIMLRLSTQFCVNLHWLLTGEGEMFLDRSEPPTNNNIEKTKETKAPATKDFIRSRTIKNQALSHLQTQIYAIEDPPDHKSHIGAEDVVCIPVDTKIAAGVADYYGNDEPIHYIYVSNRYIRDPRAVICFQVIGDSMEPDIRDGDYVIIDKFPDWNSINGKVCAAQTGDGITLKTLFIDPVTNQITLVPLNRKYPPIFIDDNHTDNQLLGVLIYLFRSFHV